MRVPRRKPPPRRGGAATSGPPSVAEPDQWDAVIRTDGHRGPPDFDVLDQLEWWLACNRPSPLRSLMSTDTGPEPLCQVADGRCSGGQIAAPDLMLLELLGN